MILKEISSWLENLLDKLMNGDMAEGILTPQDELYVAALIHLGKDVSEAIHGRDIAPDALACAETVTDIVATIRPDIQWTQRVSTYYCRRDLMSGRSFARVKAPQAGDIVISATGYGGKNGVKVGHMGILMQDGKIASNDSRTGLFDINYSLDSWRRYYVERGGFEMLFFRLKV